MELDLFDTSINFINCDCFDYLPEIKNESVKAVITDPPWKYLKNQKLEKDFDENLFFSECRRILKDDGFIVLFGRGTSFYRWNNILENLGFVFKEEFIWDKAHTSSPVLPVNRVHETISIHTKKSGILNKIKIPYSKTRNPEDLSKVINDVNRLKGVLNNKKALKELNDFFDTGLRNDFKETETASKYGTTYATKKLGAKLINCANSVVNGFKPFSIMKIRREHYKTIHPTQKPVELMCRLIQLTTDEKDLVVDPFAGSCSTGIAAYKLARDFFGCESDQEYYDKAVDRIKNEAPNKVLQKCG